MPDAGDDDAFIARILRDVLEDRAAGRERPAAEYIARAPGREDAVRRALEEIGDAAATGPPDPATERPALGPYRLLERIGAGGQGEVWRARDTRLGRQVALKILRGLGGLSEEGRSRFRREAEIAARLDHPGICRVFDAGIADGTPYIAMLFVPGETLALRIARARDHSATIDEFSLVAIDSGRHPPASPAAGVSGNAARTDRSEPRRGTEAPRTRLEVHRIVAAFEKIALALHAAHAAGVIHRDIKPGNIMIPPGGDPVILDFGLARAEDADLPTLTHTGDVFGTPAYMSPEQLGGGRGRVDARTDIWSLGVTLFECLALARPFDAPTREALHAAILTREPPSLRRLNPAVGDDLRVVVETALEKDPDRRYQSAADLAEDLRRVRAREPIRARPVPAAVKAWRWAERHPGVALAGSAAVLFLVAGTAVAWVLRGQAVAKGREAEANLQAFNRLADARILEDLLREQERDLWPAAPEKAPAMEAWLRRARALAGNLPGHEAELAALRASARPWSEVARAADREALAPELDRLAAFETRVRAIEADIDALEGSEMPEARKERLLDYRSRELEATRADLERERARLEPLLAERRTWEFDDPARRWRHDQLAALVTGLRAFATNPGKQPGIRDVEERLDFTASLRRRTVEDHAAAWTAAIARVGGNARYGGLVLAVQPGLIPLGPDPASTLEEFSDSATGDRPERGPDGRIDVRESTALVFVLLPGGAFAMGAQAADPEAPNHDSAAEEDESPVHEAVVAPFLLSKFEMTQGQFRRFTGTNPSFYVPGQIVAGGPEIDHRHPVENLSWTRAAETLRRLGCRPPSEAEWEYACRAGTATPWWPGRDVAAIQGTANLADRSYRTAADTVRTEAWDDGFPVHAPVGSFAANAFGLHDTHGNVWELCADAYRRSYDPRLGPADGVRTAGGIPYRVYRGGSFSFASDVARSADRHNTEPDGRFSDLGLRPARSLSRDD